MSEIKIISYPTPVEAIRKLTSEQFMDMVKGVVDVEQEIMAVGGSLHSDEEKMLLDKGSQQQNLWGINIYFEVEKEDRIEFDCMINLRPTQANRSRSVEDLKIRERIISITNHLLIF